MKSVKDKIEKLRDELHKHNYFYYVKDRPIISDYDFDIKLKELINLENQFPQYYDVNSPTQRVGGSIVKFFNSVKHQFPMYSLDNSYSKEDLILWTDRLYKNLNSKQINYLCELKFDGVSINLTYENGFLTKAVTRGDGVQGDDVTENIKTIKTIPLKLNGKNYPKSFQIRGEIIIGKKDFKTLNKNRTKIGLDNYMNPRNTASGSLKLQDSIEAAKRPLKCFLYQIVSKENIGDSQNENLKHAYEWGFNISKTYKKCKNLNEIMDFINHWESKKDELDFEIDGIVIKVNSIQQQKDLGFTSKYPRWAIAYKYKTEQISTKLLSVSYQVGRTGAITPVANLSPVLIGGTTVKRASLHNQDQIEKLDLHLNDNVIIEKGGEIIPKIVSVEISKRDTSQKKIEFIKNCPSCFEIIQKKDSEAQHYCLNYYNCPPQIIGRIQHFVSRKAMDIDGIGNETIDLLFRSGLIRNYFDLYKLKRENLIQLERMAEKSIYNIFKGLEESKKIGFDRVLFALGIRYVGQTVSKKIVQQFKSIDKLIQSSKEELVQVDEIGERISESLIEFFSIPENIELIENLKDVGLQFEQLEDSSDGNNSLANKSFVISGVFKKNSREEIKKLIETNGGKSISSISSKTDYLIGGNNIGPKKMNKANELKIPIISEDEFLELING